MVHARNKLLLIGARTNQTSDIKSNLSAECDFTTDLFVINLYKYLSYL